jgi:excinuclease ABC subunit B
MDYNEAHHIEPQSIIKPIDMSLVAVAEADYVTVPLGEEPDIEKLSPEQFEGHLADLEREMREAAKRFEFERAAQLRDRLKALRARSLDSLEPTGQAAQAGE